jgi:hypothetical protein
METGGCIVKYKLIVFLIVLLVFAGYMMPYYIKNAASSPVARGASKSGEAHVQLTVELEFVSRVLNGGWVSGNPRYDTYTVINDLDELRDFMKGDISQLEDVYNDEFFEDSVIYCYIKPEGSGSITMTADKVEVEGNKLRLFMTRWERELLTCDMASQICFFGVKRAAVSDVKNVRVKISDRKVLY